MWEKLPPFNTIDKIEQDTFIHPGNISYINMSYTVQSQGAFNVDNILPNNVGIIPVHHVYILSSVTNMMSCDNG